MTQSFITALKSAVIPSWFRQRRWNAKNLGIRTTPTGLNIPVNSLADWIIYNEIFERGAYDKALDFAFATYTDEKPPLVIDLGANVGYFMLRVLEESRQSDRPDFQIVAVEADPRTHQVLVSQLKPQPFKHHPILHQGWVGKPNGKVFIARAKEHFATTTAVENETGISIECLNLDTIIPPKTEIALLKCDIEGAESEFVEHYPHLLSHCRAVCIESHSISKRDQCLKALKQAGLSEQSELEHEETESRFVHLATRPDEFTQ